jgi:hypothetical protein
VPASWGATVSVIAIGCAILCGLGCIAHVPLHDRDPGMGQVMQLAYAVGKYIIIVSW